MTESGFNQIDSDAPQGRLIPLDKKGNKRFSRYKVRLYGVLHFVKKPSESFKNDLLAFEALRKEFSIGYPLNHPSIVRYIRFERDELYEEFIEGKTLREMIDEDDTRLHEKGFLEDICRQLLEALSYIHSRGVLHLDIKPENVMVTDIGNRVKLIDFGCARSADCDSTPGHTPEYMAPEQADGNSDVSTDIYLLGRLFEELVLVGNRQRRWKKFLSRASAPDPSQRFKTAAEALEAVPGSQKSRLLPVLLAVVLAGIVAVAAGLWFGLREPEGIVRETRVVDTLYMMAPQDTVGEVSEVEPIPQSIDVPTAEVASPLPPAETETVKPPNAQSPVEVTRREVEKDIENYVKNYYRKHVDPVCDDHSLDGVNKYGDSTHQDAIKAAVNQAVENSVEYGRQLSAKYPELKTYITSYVLMVLESTQYNYLDRYCTSTTPPGSN